MYVYVVLAVMDGNHLVESFEASFQNCFAAITSHEHYNIGDIEEVKSSVEQNVQKFLDIGRQLEALFLQKRQLLCMHKPEQLLKEEIVDMKQELARKEILIQKHHDKLQHWQSMLSRAHSGQQQSGTAAAGATNQATGATSAATIASQQTVSGSQANVSVTVPQTVTAANINQAAMNMQQQQNAAAASVVGVPGGMLPQGPLAYLEQTTSSIGLPERR